MASAEPALVESVWIDAEPDRVFPFFTDPARLTQWLGQAAELDPVPGGRFAVDMGPRLVRGSYLEVQPPSRVVFSWGDAGSERLPPGSTVVEVDLEASGSGTKVTLRHQGLGDEERVEHARGWPMKLGQLAAAV